MQSTLSIPQLRAALNGRGIAPDDAGYDQARAVFYGGFDRRPAVIVRVADATDVARVVSLARQTGLELAIRSGGHSNAGHSVSDGGIVLDLGDMRALDIDVAARTAWAQTGLTAGDYTTATGKHGLATGFGDTGSVGIGGITLGGGVGFLVRKHGLTIDDLLAAEVVTADGQQLRVDAHTHPDLFWAIRGGGGNFGVATRLKLRLHPLGTIVGGILMLPATPEVIASFVAQAQAAPEELSTIANILPAHCAKAQPRSAATSAATAMTRWRAGTSCSGCQTRSITSSGTGSARRMSLMPRASWSIAERTTRPTPRPSAMLRHTVEPLACSSTVGSKPASRQAPITAS